MFRHHLHSLSHSPPHFVKVGSSCADKVFRVWDTKTFKETREFAVSGWGKLRLN